jgi:hypothetical protein
LLCLGVNRAPDAPDAGFAEANARTVHRLFTGALAPPRITATCLLGDEATKERVTQALSALGATPPPFVLLYVAGTLSSRGLLLADGPLEGDVLEKALTATAPSAALALLDLVGVGGRRKPAELPSFLQNAADAHPGLRVALGRGAVVGAGAQGEGLGRFTAAVLQALLECAGDVALDGTPFVSDRRALEAAAAIARRRWDESAVPQCLGPLGDFPLLRSQAERAVGEGRILAITPGATLSVRVDHLLTGRRHVPTHLHYALLDPDGECLAEGMVTLTPDADSAQGHTRLRVPARVLRRHAIWGPALEVGEVVHLRWRVELRDAFGHILSRRTVGHEHAQPSRRA